MDEMPSKLVVATTAMCATLMAVVPDMVWLLLAAQVVDIISGMIVAYNKRTLCSTIARKGMTKKCMMLILVCLAYALEHMIRLPIGTAAASYYASMELLSITENAGLMGIPIAPAIKRGLDALRGDDKNGNKPV